MSNLIGTNIALCLHKDSWRSCRVGLLCSLSFCCRLTIQLPLEPPADTAWNFEHLTQLRKVLSQANKREAIIMPLCSSPLDRSPGFAVTPESNHLEQFFPLPKPTPTLPATFKRDVAISLANHFNTGKPLVGTLCFLGFQSLWCSAPAHTHSLSHASTLFRSTLEVLSQVQRYLEQ